MGTVRGHLPHMAQVTAHGRLRLEGGLTGLGLRRGIAIGSAHLLRRYLMSRLTSMGLHDLEPQLLSGPGTVEGLRGGRFLLRPGTWAALRLLERLFTQTKLRSLSQNQGNTDIQMMSLYLDPRGLGDLSTSITTALSHYLVHLLRRTIL